MRDKSEFEQLVIATDVDNNEWYFEYRTSMADQL